MARGQRVQQPTSSNRQTNISMFFQRRTATESPQDTPPPQSHSSHDSPPDSMPRRSKVLQQETAAPPAKRKRGRPRKADQPTADDARQAEDGSDGQTNSRAGDISDTQQQPVVGRGRGRPPGSRGVKATPIASNSNSNSNSNAPAPAKRGRGRPPKNGGAAAATGVAAGRQTLITLVAPRRGRSQARGGSVAAVVVSDAEQGGTELQPEVRRGRSRSRTRAAVASVADIDDEPAAEPQPSPKRRRGRLPRDSAVTTEAPDEPAEPAEPVAEPEPEPATRRSRSRVRADAATAEAPAMPAADGNPAAVPPEPAAAAAAGAAAEPQPAAKRPRGRPRKDGTAPRPNPAARARAAAKRAAELERWSMYNGEDGDSDGDGDGVYDDALGLRGAAETPPADAEHGASAGGRRRSRPPRGRGRGRGQARGPGRGRGRLATAPRVAAGRLAGHLVDDEASSGRLGQCGSVARARTTSAYRLFAPARWMGPTLHDMWTNANYIDTGLSRDAWEAIRHVQVDAAAMREPGEPGGQAGGPVDVRMVDAGLRPLAAARLAAEQAARLAGAAPGWVANAGLPVWSADWLPQRPDAAADPAATVDYVAVGGMAPGAPMRDVLAATPGRCAGSPGVVQVWRVATGGGGGGCSLALTLAHAFGRCLRLRWCPAAAADPATLGVLAAAFGDGHLRVCVVPRPPGDGGVVRLRWPAWSLVDAAAPGRAVFSCFEWAASDLLVAGTSAGLLTAWALGTCAAAQHAAAQRAGAPWPYSWKPRGPHAWAPACVPAASHQVHVGAVLDLSATATSAAHGAVAQARVAGDFRAVRLEAVHVQSAGRDGRLRHTLLGLGWRQHHVVSTLLGQVCAQAALWLTGNAVYGDADGCLRLVTSPILSGWADPWTRACFATGEPEPEPEPDREGQQPPRWALDGELLHSSSVATTDAPVQSVAASAFHAYVVAGSSDGSVRVQNTAAVDMCRMRTWSRRMSTVMVDGEAGAGEGRLVCVAADPPVPAKEALKKVNRVYPPHVDVAAVAWSRNPRSATWMVSATLAGVVLFENVVS
ncbi:hypothetical protein LPJ53_002442 [Coemansia erecta]|uniref:Uncharacterized protein n=1 Tax=Coemansia erecta TaxID=147472 RepID=A0A9W7Y220_9FUNG|nr:hypothetical protein LPJ53_002442 [Coemansia erecta]